GELSSILEQKGQYVADYSIESIKKALLQMKEDHLEKGTASHFASYKEFEYGNLTKQLIEYLDK
ncbi:MAG: hypothetical protein GY705_17925, partial [Bacteroidetes bacterium]|nr:hypothetical protein [Bacteroidota bacterium]